MSDMAKDYVLAEATPSAELKRLREIDHYMRPTTEARIARLGIAPGWKCLDVGAGAGGVARWMAEKVGNTGSVTATDIAPKIDLDPRLPWLEARKHNILEPGLVDSRYDLVHCRLLLIHVSPVEVALRNMVRALRPGGWLIVWQVPPCSNMTLRTIESPSPLDSDDRCRDASARSKSRSR